jgi:hypothetical protein
MERKSMVDLILKRRQKILPAIVVIAPFSLPGSAIYKIELNQHIGDLILVKEELKCFVGSIVARSGLNCAASTEPYRASWTDRSARTDLAIFDGPCEN